MEPKPKMLKDKLKMLKEEYFVLRVKSRTTRDLFKGHFGGPDTMKAIATATATLDLNDLSLDSDEMGPDDALRAAQSRDVVAVALAMPIRLIEPVSIAPTSAMPLAAQVAWGVTAVGADTSRFQGSGCVVAVLDTGIDAAHPAFAGVEVIQKDFTGQGDGDQHGHGTHCAGTIFGRDVNGVRIGVAPKVSKALIGKVLGPGGGSSLQIAQAIQWAVDNGAHVISMSLGMDFPGLREKYAQIRGLPGLVATSMALEGLRTNVLLFEKLAAYLQAGTAFQQPSLLIAAAGNESNRPAYELAVSPPAVSEGFISVGALGQDQGTQGLSVAKFSNTGANIAAPGVDILSAAPGGGYVKMSGTSMATPHVAGVAALWCEKYHDNTGTFTPQFLTGKILGTAETTQLEAGYDDSDVGAGLVRAPQN